MTFCGVDDETNSYLFYHCFFAFFVFVLNVQRCLERKTVDNPAGEKILFCLLFRGRQAAFHLIPTIVFKSVFHF